VGGWLESAVDWIVALVHDWGYPGIFVMMMVESTVFPFPSEVALIPAGYLASQGKMDPVLATLAGGIGSIAGAFVNYGLALWFGRAFLDRLERFERWMPFPHGGIHASVGFFERHGEIATFVGRLVPGIRHLISLPAGLARMNVARFALYTGLGAGLWSGVLVAIGMLAGASEELWRPMLRDATLWLFAGVGCLISGYVYFQRRASRRA
jgi:membrane protein DedA with SNARE-associated domain